MDWRDQTGQAPLRPSAPSASAGGRQADHFPRQGLTTKLPSSRSCSQLYAQLPGSPQISTIKTSSQFLRCPPKSERTSKMGSWWSSAKSSANAPLHEPMHPAAARWCRRYVSVFDAINWWYSLLTRCRPRERVAFRLQLWNCQAIRVKSSQPSSTLPAT